ncbi:hypothetical protein F4778DRAFT_272511 [Xylariomycetidae sp. FL2044]|nr:hypothetical protein F4778DRAFT_272511 [Xylariomycetidae sp. FL2044]
MPYLYSENLEFLTKRRGASLARPSTLIYCLTNDPKDFGADVEVTLDEFCNPALDSEVLKQRNRDQVLTRYGQRKLGLSTGHNQSLSPELLSQLRLITVPQIWCWKIGSRLIFSCPKSANEDLKALRISPQTDNPDVFIGRLLSRFVDTLDRPKMLGLSEPIFSVFSKSIAIVAEDVNRYTRTAEFDDISIEKETQYLHVINDIREEIAMIQTVLFQQEEVWKEFVYNTWPDAEDRYFQGPGRSQTQSKIWRPPEAQSELWREIFKPQSQFPKFRRRFEKLDEDAERVERNILVKLDLKQKHASIKETHTATVMSAAIVGFTVITIIFAPLSFLTSLFALPVDQFRQDNGQYAGSYIGKWIATGEMVSLAVTLIAILIACDYFLNLRVTSRLWRKKSLEAKEKKQAGSWDGSMTGDTPNEKQAGNGEGRRHFLWHSKPRRQRKSRAADLEEALNSTEVP